MLLKIENSHVQSVKFLWDKYGHNIKLPASDDWSHKTNDEIWLRLVSQVVVVGRAEPAQGLKTAGVRERISWSELAVMSTDVENEIWKVLREIGTRFAGKSAHTCRKTKAIYQNLLVLKKFSGGPTGFLQKIAEIDLSEDKIAFITQRLAYIKQKGARDFLTSGFGMIQDRIALDIRVLRELRNIGINGLPNSTPGDADIYRAIERELIEGICNPLQLSGAQLDQLLFNLDEYQLRK